MGCCGKHRKSASESEPSTAKERGEYGIRPSDACVLCAEKHLSTAYALAVERGYETPNRQRIIGELSAAGMHLHLEHRELAESIRDMRHLIQYRRESEVDWTPVSAEIDKLAAAEAAKLKSEEAQKYDH